MATKSTPKRSTAAGKGAAKSSAAEQPSFDLTTSRQFESWLSEIGGSLAFTTYQAGKLFFLGLDTKGRLAVFNRTIERCMGLAVAGPELYVASLTQIYRFVDAMNPAEKAAGEFDAAYVPQVAYYTGDVDAHDLARDGDGRLLFANTLFSCVAAVGERHSFVPVWQPPFVSRLGAEDRCHLNGLALDAGRLAYVTAVADSDVADGWRDRRADGGLVVDCRSGETVAAGLSMPHSPRLHQGRLCLLDSGTGRLGTVDRKSGRFEALAFCPGYLRGLAFAGDYAVVGLSKPRGNKTFEGLALDAALAKHKMAPRCGLYVIDLRSGDVVHWVRIEGIVSELYDVVVLPGTRSPMAVGFRSDEIRRVISIGTESQAARLS